VPDTLSPPSGIGPAAPTGLGARIAGVIFSPGETYRSIVAHPRVLGVLAVTTIVMAAVVFAFLSTEVGQNAVLDYQMRAMESFGINVPDEIYDRMEQQVAGMGRYISPVSILVTIPLICTAVAGVMLLIFNVALGGDATFKQALAVVAHAEIAAVHHAAQLCTRDDGERDDAGGVRAHAR
jgi:hypothetical protein